MKSGFFENNSSGLFHLYKDAKKACKMDENMIYNMGSTKSIRED